MSLDAKPLTAITEKDLLELVANAAQEGKTLEFKRNLPGPRDADRKEFLADVSSFANAAGGDLFFGIEQENGRAIAVPGLSEGNSDAEVLRLDSMIRDGVAPRMRSEAKVVDLAQGQYVVLLRIPRSWAAPHMVTFQGSSRFFSRHSAGKYPLDVGELRAAFLLGETASTRMRSFRIDRIAQIVAGETPVALGEGPKVSLHMMPFSSLDPGYRLSFPIAREVSNCLYPLAENGCSPRYNFNGFLAAGSASYTQLFRTGAIETATGEVGSRERNTLPGGAVEQAIIEAVLNYRRALRLLNVAPPIAVAVTLTGVKGYRMYHAGPIPQMIDRDTLFLPEVMIDEEAIDTAKLLRPAFDALWSACGVPRSPNYSEDGEWQRTG